MTEPDLATWIEPGSVHPCAESLRDYALGRLPEDDLVKCAAHLETCSGCRQFVETVPGDALVALVQSASHGEKASSEASVPLRLHRGFEIMEEIGRGGMAVVFKARQLDLGRIVAFKQIKPELMTAEGLLRFRVEAGVMARIQHANIVQIHDVGEQEGKPYIAFEFIPGGGLDRQLSGNPLPVRSASRLLATLARAVQVAHDQSVIHRDLKPSNVLLTWDVDLSADPSDEKFWERVVPKICDFGLAKHLSQPQSQTQTGEILGTPGYMSPEQTRGRNDDIGPATDIFALGVMLYETLTGRRPFLSATLVQTLDLICTADPVPPSHLQPRLPADLDVVCLKCLEKEPRRRYATAAEVADDLERWLAGEPIRARPVAAWERAWKWVKRNPTKGVVIAGCVGILVSLISGIMLHNRRLQAEVLRANRNEAVAIANFRRGHDVVQKMIDDVTDFSVSTEAWRLLRDNLYSRAREYHESALEGADDSNPDVRLAKTMARIYRGSMLVSLGEYDDAVRHLEPAREQLELLLLQSPDNADVRSSLASCYRNLAWAYAGSLDFPAAEKHYNKAYVHLSRLVAEQPGNLDFRRRLAGLYGDLGAIYSLTERNSLSQRAYSESLDLWKNIAGDASFSDNDRARFGKTCLDIAAVCRADGRVEESESYLKQGEVMLSPAPGRSSSLWVRKLLAETFWYLSELAISRHQPDLALVQTDKAIDVIRDVLSQEPREEAAHVALVRYYSGKSRLLDELDRPDETLAVRNKAIEFADPVGLAAILLPSIREHRLQNRWANAEAELNQMESRVLSIPRDSRTIQVERILADVYFEWAELAIAQGELDNAVSRYDRSIETLNELLIRIPDDAESLATLSGRHRLKAWHLSRAGRTDMAFAAWDLAIHYAAGDLRNFTQAERALERALLGDHAGASQEAHKVAEQPELKVDTAVHLARVYCRCIEALEQDVQLTSADRDRLTTSYAAAAIRCLGRAGSLNFEESAERAELASDAQLAALRTTHEFQQWFQRR